MNSVKHALPIMEMPRENNTWYVQRV